MQPLMAVQLPMRVFAMKFAINTEKGHLSIFVCRLRILLFLAKGAYVFRKEGLW